jgi:endogenous inhibitor of DNA gyrase (YacG/DUF329 family)
MARKKVRSLRCPICRTIVLRKDPEFPFCSERCRLIDLGKWASGRYVISTPITDPEEYEDAERKAAELRRKSTDGETSG